jgi:hypothetical protein
LRPLGPESTDLVRLVSPSGLISMVDRICSRARGRLDNTFAELEGMDPDPSGMGGLIRDEVTSSPG